MTEIKTLIYKDRTGYRWVADVALDAGGTWITFAPTWAEAMQAAQAMRDLLARLLLDQVHAERTVRRYGPIVLPSTAPTCTCSTLPGTHPAADCDAITTLEHLEATA